MNSFYDKLEYDISDIKSLIKNEIEESIHLDYKEAQALDKSDVKKKEISKDVSAFANSDGGIIIYGIRELNHKAVDITYIDGNIFTKEWLEQTINSSIQRRIPDIKIYPIRNNGNINESIYVVKIPKSFETPHICKDKRFYKRFNFESVPMEEYEIRLLYGQKIKSKLVIGGWSLGVVSKEEGEEGKLKFRFEVTVINEGDIVENSYKVNVYFMNINKYVNISWPLNMQHYDFTWLENNRVKVSSNGLIPIYPNETVNAIRFNFDIPKDRIEEALKEIKLEIMLFYSNGEEKIDGDLFELVDKVLNPHNYIEE